MRSNEHRLFIEINIYSNDMKLTTTTVPSPEVVDRKPPPLGGSRIIWVRWSGGSDGCDLKHCEDTFN